MGAADASGAGKFNGAPEVVVPGVIAAVKGLTLRLHVKSVVLRVLAGLHVHTNNSMIDTAASQKEVTTLLLPCELLRVIQRHLHGNRGNPLAQVTTFVQEQLVQDARVIAVGREVVRVVAGVFPERLLLHDSRGAKRERPLGTPHDYHAEDHEGMQQSCLCLVAAAG